MCYCLGGQTSEQPQYRDHCQCRTLLRIYHRLFKSDTNEGRKAEGWICKIARVVLEECDALCTIDKFHTQRTNHPWPFVTARQSIINIARRRDRALSSWLFVEHHSTFAVLRQSELASQGKARSPADDPSLAADPLLSCCLASPPLQ